jgi:hypothetical protein
MNYHDYLNLNNEEKFNLWLTFKKYRYSDAANYLNKSIGTIYRYAKNKRPIPFHLVLLIENEMKYILKNLEKGENNARKRNETIS